MITFRRENGKMPSCGRCSLSMTWWDLREDESTYRCDECQKKDISDFWEKVIEDMFKEIKDTQLKNESSQS